MSIAICALTLLAGTVGAGFASGREIVRFFASHGGAAWAAVSSTCAALPFFFLRLCSRMDAAKVGGVFSLCRARFGERVGAVCGALFFLLSAVTAGAMLAACAELGALLLPLRHAYALTLAVSLLLALCLARRGMKGLAFSGATLLALLPVLLLRLLALPVGEACFLPAMTPDLPVRAVSDGISYAALNASLLLGASPLLLSLPKEKRTRGVFLFCLVFASLLALGCAVCLRHMPTVSGHPMPFVELSRQLSGVYLLLAACMYAAALSTLAAMVSALLGMLPLAPLPAALVIGSLLVALALVGFGAIVQSAYPVLGAVCAGLLILLCV